MDNQTVRQAMQQAAAQQQAAQQQVAQQQATKQHIVTQQAMYKEPVAVQGQEPGKQQSAEQQEAGQLSQASQENAKDAEQAQREKAQQRRKREEAQRARQRAQQRAQQQNAAKRRRNNLVKILLVAILVLQVICSVQLFMVLQTANRIMDTLEAGVINIEGDGVQSADGNSISANAGIEDAIGHGSNMVGSNDTMGNSSSVNGGNGVSGSGNMTVQDSENQKEQTKESVIPEEDAWKLVLVNKWNEMEEGYVPELTEYAEGHRVDARIEDALRDMIGGAKKAGYAIYLLSAYRDVDRQIELYEAEVAKWKAAGYSKKDAEEKAGTVVAVPGTSEHHLGLAVDLVSSEHVKLDEGAEKTKGYKWLVAHCHEYGFILRYPNEATEITGIIYEPWHFRYVGVEAATEIMEAGITLEEYLEQLQ